MPEQPNIPNHHRKIRTYTVLFRVFLPIGIAVSALCLIADAIFTIFLTASVYEYSQAGCTANSSGAACAQFASATITFTVLLSVFGSLFLFFGLPAFIAALCFRKAAKRNQLEDEANAANYLNPPSED